MKIFVQLLLLLTIPIHAFALSPAELVKEAIDYWRGKTSYTEAQMTINRDDWKRTMKFQSWTMGTDKTLVRFTEPAKDAGSASLKNDNKMWSYSPKVNKVIKIPPSMMGQSWMGSDFSYNDLAKADDIVKRYSHKLLNEEERDAHKFYTVESIPLENAPVVWGKEILVIRDDYIIFKHQFFDQDMKLVKELTAEEIAPMGGKLIAKVIRMKNVEEKNEWTEIVHSKAEFGIEISNNVFTLSYLRNPRNL
ncbi:MAG: outer membrane lipoprotein-sorting protein [Deltaproteobacteria bacterium]|nr:outer membrane lipoprotein-sorting protein [Deltaproteobacteria bacterium]